MADKKLQIKRRSGKIFGPYTFREVLSFIYTKKLDGSEKVMFEGSSKWQDINSVNEFFDAFQEVLFGVEPVVSQAPQKKASKKTVVRAAGDADDQTAISTKMSKTDDSTQVSYEKPSPPKKKEPKQNKNPKAGFKAESPNPFVLPEPDEAKVEGEKLQEEHNKKDKPKPNLLRMALILALVFSGAYYFLQHSGSTTSNSGTALNVENINRVPVYFRPLVLRLAQILPLNIGEVPAGLPTLQTYSLPEGFGAHLFVTKVKKIQEIRVDQRSSEEWAQLAWSLKWLGEILSTYDKTSSDFFNEIANRVYVALDEQSVLPPDYKLLYENISRISSGQISEASKALDKVDTEFGAWILSEVDWLLLWQNKVSPEAWMEKHGSLSPMSKRLEAKHIVKKLFLSKSDDAPFWFEQLAVEDPVSFSLWFVGAEYFWRVKSSLLQKSYLYWQAGLGVSSLYPRAFQVLMLKEAANLINLYGRAKPAEVLIKNTKLVLEGNVFASKSQWAPLLGAEIDTDISTDRTLSMGAERRLSPTELASLQSLTFTLSRRGGEKLLQVAYYYIFEKDYERALSTIEAATNFSDAKEEAWGAKVWVDAERFHFDKAFEALDKVKQNASETPKDQVYEAILYFYGREYDQAKSLFESYLKRLPASGIGHYFQARMHEALGKNVDCAKAAYLGGSNGVGEIGFRSRMLFYRCRILAKLNVSTAIADLKKIFNKDPSNTAAVVEYIRGLSNADLDGEAIEEGRIAVQRYPRSYPLRLALGDAYFKAQKYDQALAFYNNAIQFRPSSAEAFVKIGDLLYQQERYQKAAENYGTAASLNSEFPEIWLKAAEAYKKAGNKDEAIEAYKKEISARPSVVQTFLDFSEYLLEQNMPQSVVDTFTKHQSVYNDDPRIAVRLAQAYMGLQEFRKARERAAYAQAQLPTNAQVYRVLGIISEVEGNYPSAKRHFEKYLSLVPQASDADAIRRKISQPPY